MALSFKVTPPGGFQNFLRFMNENQLADLDLKPLHKAGVIRLHQWVQKNFQQRGQLHKDSSLRWPDQGNVSELGAMLRRLKHPSASISMNDAALQDTGTLRKSFEITADNLKGQLINRTSYAEVHEYGLSSVIPNNPSVYHGFAGKTVNVRQRKMFPTVEQGREIVIPAYREFARMITNKGNNAV